MGGWKMLHYAPAFFTWMPGNCSIMTHIDQFVVNSLAEPIITVIGMCMYNGKCWYPVILNDNFLLAALKSFNNTLGYYIIMSFTIISVKNSCQGMVPDAATGPLRYCVYLYIFGDFGCNLDNFGAQIWCFSPGTAGNLNQFLIFSL